MKTIKDMPEHARPRDNQKGLALTYIYGNLEGGIE